MKTETPPLSEKTDKQKDSNGKKRARKAQIAHTSPKGLRTGLNRLMNEILECDDPLSHAGQYASLANAMTASQKFTIEIGEWKKVQERVDALEKEQQKE
jgi:hypothetical protein